MKKRDGIDDLISNTVQSKQEEIQKNENQKESSADNVKVEPIRLTDVFFNKKNKRLITQFIRFIPDSLAQDFDSENQESFLKKNIDSIPINNVIRELNNLSNADTINYPNHSDLYEINTQGVFIGKNICFHNVETKDKNLENTLDLFVEQVKRSGKSILKNGDLTEKPKVIKVGGQKYRLIFGHQRLCYLFFAFGGDYNYHFNVHSGEINEDLTIYLENGTKTEEYGYEKLLSYHYAYLSLKGTKNEDILSSLSIKKSQYYNIKPFIDDIDLINIVKEVAINAPLTFVVNIYKEVAQSLKLKPETTYEIIKETFKDALFKKWHNKKLNQKDNSKEKVLHKVSIKAKPETIEKILFNDVSSFVNIENYDLSEQKEISKLIKDIIDKIEEK